MVTLTDDSDAQEHAAGAQAGPLARAHAHCAAHGARLTPIRARVLELLAGSPRPLGAYDLIELLGDADGRRPAPITVYRALDFLLEQALVHRIESRNAFLACDHTHGRAELVVFLLCQQCGSAVEAPGPEIAGGLATLARAAGFSVRGQVVEIAGECATCRAAARTA